MLFFTAAIAETKRAPFDIPEGEPEIIGYFVEYSGMRWGMFFLAEFIEIVFSAPHRHASSSAAGRCPSARDGFLARPPAERRAVVLVTFAPSAVKVILFCWFQLMHPLDAAALPRRSADEPRLEAPAAAVARQHPGDGAGAALFQK